MCGAGICKLFHILCNQFLYYDHISSHAYLFPWCSLPILSEFCTLCICFAYLWSLLLSYLAMLCTRFISGSRSSQDLYIADCQAASVLSIGYCYACTLAFLGLPKLFVPTLLLFLFHGSKSRLPSLGLHHDSESTYIRVSLSIES